MQTAQLNLSKGAFVLLKDHLRTNNKLSDYNKKKLTEELKTANVVARKDVPREVVDLDTWVKVTDLESKREIDFSLVHPTKAKVSKNKLSVLSPIGVALLGYNEGDEVEWEMPEGLKVYKIEEVKTIEA